MNEQWEAILKSKQALREQLAALPIEEKLRLLDELRERSLDIAASRAQRMSDEDLLERSENAARQTRFEIEQTEEIVREYRRKKQT